MKKLKIAMAGVKGIPAKWGGIEKYVEEVSVRLAALGHDRAYITEDAAYA